MHLIAITGFALAATAAMTSSTAPQSTSTPYGKVEEYSGSSFFDGFDTFTGADPTAGYVDYVSLETAARNNLTAFVWDEATQRSNALIGVDYQQRSTNATNGRQSVRLVSKRAFGIGLLTVVDVVHAPTGPGVWPAVWLLANVSGVTWPAGGELDIMEWVNDATFNAMTLHTAPGCVVERDPSAYVGQMAQTDCNAGDGGLGCSIDAPSSIWSRGKNLSTAGPAFNAQRGGVYVHEWSEAGVTEWLFPRDCVPPDLRDEVPDPSSWSAKPLAKWTGAGCQFDRAFQQQQLIINICLCGDWAGEVWQSSGMANQTGVATCDAYVAGHPRAFEDAYFEFASIKMYSSNAAEPALAERNSRAEGDTSGTRAISVSEDAHVDHRRRSMRQHLRTHRRQWTASYNISGNVRTKRNDNHVLSSWATEQEVTGRTSGATPLEIGCWLVGASIFTALAALM